MYWPIQRRFERRFDTRPQPVGGQEWRDETRRDDYGQQHENDALELCHNERSPGDWPRINSAYAAGSSTSVRMAESGTST